MVCKNPNGVAGGSTWAYSSVKITETEGTWGGAKDCQLKDNTARCTNLLPETKYWVNCEAALDSTPGTTANGVASATT